MAEGNGVSSRISVGAKPDGSVTLTIGDLEVSMPVEGAAKLQNALVQAISVASYTRGSEERRIAVASPREIRKLGG